MVKYRVHRRVTSSGKLDPNRNPGDIRLSLLNSVRMRYQGSIESVTIVFDEGKEDQKAAV